VGTLCTRALYRKLNLWSMFEVRLAKMHNGCSHKLSGSGHAAI
jgi:hypothetical protein